MKSGTKSTLIPAGITWRKTGEEAVILNLETSEYYSANETGTFIWELLADGKDRDGTVRALASEYGISPERAAMDVDAFFRDLAKLKIVSTEAGK